MLVQIKNKIILQIFKKNTKSFQESYSTLAKANDQTFFKKIEKYKPKIMLNAYLMKINSNVKII